MSLRMLARSSGEVPGLNRRYPSLYCSSCRCRTLGEPQAMFQALQAAFRRFCLSPIVSPTPRKPAAISEIISDILRLVGLLDFLRRLMLGLQGIETEVRPDHRPQPFPETSASGAPKGRGRRIPAGRRRVLPGFRCAVPRRGRCTPCPYSAGSGLAVRWSWNDSLESLPFLHDPFFIFRLGHGVIGVLAGRVGIMKRRPPGRMAVNQFAASDLAEAQVGKVRLRQTARVPPHYGHGFFPEQVQRRIEDALAVRMDRG